MENQRIRLSKAMLKNALLTLLKEKSLDHITVYELCATAQINRTTFYKYYGSQAELLEDLKHDFLYELNTSLSEKQQQHEDGLSFALNYLYNHRELFNILVNAIPSQTFVAELFALPCVHNIFQFIHEPEHTSATKRKYLQTCISHGLFAVLSSWLQNDHPESVSEIKEVLSSFRTSFLQIN